VGTHAARARGPLLRPALCLLAATWAAAPLAADTIHLKNQTVISTPRAWEEGDEVKYETAGGVKSLPKSAVARIHQSPPVYVERIPVRPLDAPPPAAPVPPPRAPEPPDGAAATPEAIPRLREQVRQEPGNRRARQDLVRALNAQAATHHGRGEHGEARAALEAALIHEPKDLTTLLNLAAIQYETRDLRAAEATLQRAEAVSDQDPYIFYLAGEVYYAQDQLARAVGTWERALRLAGRTDVARLVSPRLERARREAGRQKGLGELSSRHFLLRYDRDVADYGLGQEILARLETLYDRLSHQLLSSPPETVTVILYTQEAFFDVTRAPNWSGAIFDGKIKVPVRGLTGVDEKLSAVLAHELAHAFIALAARGHCPTWLNEGIAQWAEGRRATPEEQRHLAALYRRQALPSLRELERPFSGLSAATAALAYQQSLSAVDFLVRRGGSEAALKKLLEALRAGAGPDEALRRAVGLSADEFEKAWRGHLTAEN